MSSFLSIALLSIGMESAQTFAPAVIKGRKFFNSVTGEYIPIKGVNYYRTSRPNTGILSQTNSIDFYNETYMDQWEADVANFVALGVNTIRLYAVEPGQNHAPFMTALQDAGIYVLVGLGADCENCAITSLAPPDCYPTALKERGQFIISEFARYDNVLGFSAGNEVNLVAPQGEPEFNAPCLKQFVKDMRAFLQGCPNVRQIPVGVELADVDRGDNAIYYNCRSDANDELENAEFYGINTYVYCTPAETDPQALTGYQLLLSDFASYGLTYPVMLTEFGCLNADFPTIDGVGAQRTFLQVETIFSDTYREEFVGGLVFEYQTEMVYAGGADNYPFDAYNAGNYGLGYFSPVDCDNLATPCTYVPFPQFETLSARYAAVDTSGEASMSSYTPTTTTVPACPAQFAALSSFTWPTDSVADLQCPYGGGSVPGGSPTAAAAPSSSTTAPRGPTISPAPTTFTQRPSSVPTIPRTLFPTDLFVRTASDARCSRRIGIAATLAIAFLVL